MAVAREKKVGAFVKETDGGLSINNVPTRSAPVAPGSVVAQKIIRGGRSARARLADRKLRNVPRNHE